MKQSSSKDPAARKPEPQALAGRRGVAITPPAYGLNVVDRNWLGQARSERVTLPARRPNPLVQAKLTVSAPNNTHEREADRVAAAVVQRLHAPAVVAREHGPGVQRMLAPAQPIAPQSERGSTSAGPAWESGLQSARASGQPIATDVRESMEQAFGADFGAVRVHTGAQADLLSRAIRAQAFTTGHDVFFRQGAYAPASREGQTLLAHELTHVVQQRGAADHASVQRQFTMDDADWLDSDTAINISDLMTEHGTAERQYKADAALWYHTLFDQSKHYPAQHRQLLSEQQALLKRHFVAMAALGIQAGDQTTGVYAPYDDANVPLAAIPSHGGRFAYEAADATEGDNFFKALLVGDPTGTATVNKASMGIVKGSKSREANPAKQGSFTTAGLFSRRSTHPQRYDAGRWLEGKDSSGEITGRNLGMNIAFGGIDNYSGKKTRVGPEGAQMGNKGQYKDKQHGHAFFKYNSESAMGKRTAPAGAGGRLMVGFEGSGPGLDSLLGSHGIMSALKGNDRSITGQSKAATLGLPTQHMGGVKANVTSVGLATVQHLFTKLETLQGTDTAAARAFERKLFKALLASTSQRERNRALGDLAAL